MAIKSLSLKYIHQKNIMSQHINKDNVESLSKQQVANLIKRFDKKYWEIYSNQLIRSWYKENINYSDNIIVRYKKILKKLDIKFMYGSSIDLFKLESNIFAKNRQYKTIEVPYSNKDKTEDSAVFVFKKIILYNSNKWIRKIFSGEMYITKKEIVLYDPIEEKIFKRIDLRTIDKLELTSFSTKMTLAGEVLNFRGKDNGIIMTSFERVVKGLEVKVDKNSKNKIDSIEETIEKTGEMFLMKDFSKVEKESNN